MARTDYGSHAYWRVLCVASSFVAFSAVLFKDETGTLIATTGGTALESAHFSTFSSAALFDGVDSTFWESMNTRDEWAGYQFSTAKKVMQIALQRRSSMDGSNQPTSCWVQYSDDGKTWGSATLIVIGAMTNDVPKWFDLAQSL